MPNVAVQYDVRHYTIEEGDPSDEPYSWHGEEYQLHTPWQGYFESLTDVRVETVGAAYHYSARGY